MELFLLLPVIWSKNFFNKSFPIWSDNYKMNFKKQKMELLKQEMELFLPSPVTWSKKQEMEISRQEMELFLPLPVIWSKKNLNKRFPIWSDDFKMVFRNRKWNYLDRKWNCFSNFQSSDQKTSLTNVSPFGLTISKWFSETGNAII
jgi:hypothetical protein